MTNIADVIYWRSISAVVWTVALEAALLVFLICVGINLMSPITWLQALSTVTSLHLWMFFLPLAGITVAQGMMYTKKYLTLPKFSNTRFGYVKSFLSLHNFVMLIIFPLMSFAVTWTFLSSIGKDYLNVTGPCKIPAQKCMTESYVFLVLSSIWSGIYLFLAHYIWESNILTFPVVQQLKYVQIKSELLAFIKLAMYKAIWPNMYFLIFFYFKSDFIFDVFGLSVARSELDLLLIFHAWLFTTIFVYTALLTKHLIKVYLSQHLIFPAVCVLEGSVTLHQAIAMKEQPLVQNLGCYDLMVLASNDFCRRQELYSLSQPGGHPHNWNALIKEVIKLIDGYCSDLNAANLEAGISMNSSKVIPENTLASPVVAQPVHLHSMRNLSLARDPVEQNSNFSIASVPFWDYFSDLVKKRVLNLVDAFKRKPIIHFFFGGIPDAGLRYVLWAAQGVACLAARSLKEDKYGVVLKDLPVLVSSLVNLKQALDKIPKTGSYKRSQRNEQDEAKMKLAMKSAVKRALYNICIAYGDSILHLEVPKSVHSQLQLYLSFKEG